MPSRAKLVSLKKPKVAVQETTCEQTSVLDVKRIEKPPAPPKRRSSRNNATLRKLHAANQRHLPNRRHMQCFTADNVSNIRFLKERLCSNLNKHKRERDEARKIMSCSSLRSVADARKQLNSNQRVKMTSESTLTRRSVSTDRTNKFISLQRSLVDPQRIDKICRAQAESSRRLMNGSPTSSSKSKLKEKNIKVTSSDKIVKRSSPVQFTAVARHKQLVSPVRVETRHTLQRSTNNRSLVDVKGSTCSLSTANKKPIIVKQTEKIALVNNNKENLRKKSLVKTSNKKPQTVNVYPETPKRVVVRKKTRKARNSDATGSSRGKLSRKNEATDISNSSEDSIEVRNITSVTESQSEIRSGSRFFQSLFLRDVTSPTPSQSSLRSTTVMERAKMFLEVESRASKSEPSLKSLETYLTQKRPVSNSRFKNWDFLNTSARSKSASRVLERVFIREFGSSNSLRERIPETTVESVKERSSSEPPMKISLESLKTRASSPSPVRSAASRRIRSLKQSNKENIPFVSVEKRLRASSADSGRQKKLQIPRIFTAKSTSSLDQTKSFRLKNNNSIRYEDLHDFYTNLDRMGQLERVTSNSDLIFRLKNEEIIDYEKWMIIRSKEKAEQELQLLYNKLKAAQRDKDFLFSSVNVEKIKWRGDCNLRCKEKSVNNIREQLKQLSCKNDDPRTVEKINLKRDVYKPLWRGKSVIDTADTMAKRAEERDNCKAVHQSLQRNLGGSNKFWSSLSIDQVNALKNQLNQIYSEKVVVKRDHCNNQVTDESSRSQFEIIVPPPEEFGGDARAESKGLRVRCHSMITSTKPEEKDTSNFKSLMRKSYSIGQDGSLSRYAEIKVAPMSESEKRQLSATLGREVLDKVSRKMMPKETRGAIAAENAIKRTCPSPRTCYSLEASYEDNTKGTKERSSDILLVLTPAETEVAAAESKKQVACVLNEWAKRNNDQSSSEFDTESSDTSVRTVVERSVKQKVDRIEKREKVEKIIQERESRDQRSMKLSSQSYVDLKELFGETESARYAYTRTRSASPTLSVGAAAGVLSSTPVTVPVGNSGRGKCPSSPDARGTRQSASNNSRWPREREERERSHSLSPCRSSSLESLFDPDNYLRLFRSGTVKKLTAKFESLQDLRECHRFFLVPKRFQSDPELQRDLLRKATSRKRGGGSPPIPRIPLRLEDLAMPRINVISKLADLKSDDGQDSKTRASHSPWRLETRELEERKAVERIREIFEHSQDEQQQTSLMGAMFTSAPDVHELRDVTPYLTGQWIAHQFPNRRDTARSRSSPPVLGGAARNRSKSRGSAEEKKSQRVTNGSTSILKAPATKDIFADQEFDPDKHKPRYRYQPSPPPLSPPELLSSEAKNYCRPKNPSYTAKPTVTFKGFCKNLFFKLLTKD